VNTESIPEIQFRFEKPELKDLCRREWLETNGIGGYASSTVCGLNTRKYHGLLMAALQPPVQRVLFLSKLDEILVTPNGETELATNQYPGAITPQGYRHLRSFHLDPFPRFVYKIGEYLLEKLVFMPYEKNAVVIRYMLKDTQGREFSLEKGNSVLLKVRPFVAFRGEHQITKENTIFRDNTTITPTSFEMEPYPLFPMLHLYHNGWQFRESPFWYKNFEYQQELERGLDFREDLFTPGEIAHDFKNGAGYVLATVEAKPRANAGRKEIFPPERLMEILLEKERLRRERFLRGFEKHSHSARRLVLSADAFLVRRGESGRSVIAGYPWFGDWGRDAMIALPGLALCTRRRQEAEEVLLAFASYCRDGMIPNCFAETNEPMYNSVDASLWFIVAAWEYWKVTKDKKRFKEKMWGVIKEIISHYSNGTRYGIRRHSSGLLAAGTTDTQLTWMDAKVGDVVLTSRHGMAVEINALWYNALRIASHLAAQFGESGDDYTESARTACKAFETYFWNDADGYLYDVVHEDGEKDASIRPNQIFAVSLPFPLLPRKKALKVLECVEKNLLTPYGLRSLAPIDTHYRGAYKGDVWERDSAYHQGTVWSWLICPYARAYLRVHGKNPDSISYVKGLLNPLLTHLEDVGLGHISEIFDGDPPHEPRGCIAQAWSVGAMLRLLSEIGEV